MSGDDSDEGVLPPPPPQDEQSNTTTTTPKPKKKGVGELVNTTSFARRVASGAKPLERDRELLQAVSGESNISSSGRDTPPINWTESVGSSVSQPQDVPLLKGDSSNITPIGGSGASLATSNNEEGIPSIPQSNSSSEDNSIDISNRKMRSITHTPPVPVRKNSSYWNDTKNTNTNNNYEKSALDAFGEYVSFFFQKAEVYEEELEIQQSQRNLLDKQHHGVSNRLLSPEGGSTSSEEGETMNGMSQHSSSSQLSPQGEALAAVEAMSNFGNFGDIREKLKDEHSFDKADDGNEQKKQKLEVDGEIPRAAAADGGVDMTRLREQWTSFVKEKKKNKFKEIAIESLALPLTVDEFYNQILVDNAPHSFGKFMQDIGELNVDTTPWQPPGEPTESEPTTRIIHYTHPVNAPMAPPTAKARKEQFFNKVGGVGLCVETCTVVEEVPMADCFVVEDRLWVQENEDGGCSVAVTFQIRFVKSTYFRRIIENTTRGEYMSFFKQFHDMIISLKSPSAATDKSPSDQLEEQGELEDIAMELEQMLEGQEVPLGSVLGRIRRSSMRLSAKFPSTRKKKEEEVKVEERQAIDLQTVISFVFDSLSYVRRQITENDYAWAIAVAVFMFTLLFNLVALRRIGRMDSYLQSLDTKLEKMSEMNELLLSKLSENNNICQTVVEGP